MKNITLAIDESLLARARALAEQRNTSLNALVRSLLSHEVEQEDRIAWAKAGMKQLIDHAKEIDGGGEAYVWNRDEIYADREDRLLSRHQHPDLRGFGEES